MQTYERSDGSRFNEIISAADPEKLERRLREKQAEMEAQGHTLIEERQLTKNSKCPCGSGKKIRKCCRFIS